MNLCIEFEICPIVHIVHPEKINPQLDLNLTKNVVIVICEANIPLAPAALANLPPPQAKYSILLTRENSGIFNKGTEDPTTKHWESFSFGITLPEKIRLPTGT